MDDTPFYREWFAGVNGFLDQAGDEAFAEFIDRCAASCSASYSRGVYERAFSGGASVAEGLAALKREFADFDYALDGNRIEIRFARCGCDLVSDGLISSPRLCACSVASCKKNWETVLGPGSVTVELKASVLRGDGRCVLVVTLLPPLAGSRAKG
jgi:hypothetical protein